jgi:hypothetical protein
VQQVSEQLWRFSLHLVSLSKTDTLEPAKPSKPWPLMSIPLFQVYALLDNLVTDVMVLADELSSTKNVEESLRFCS